VFILSVVLCLYCMLSYCSKRVIVCGLIVVMCFLCYLSVVLLLYHCHRVKTHLQLIIIIIIIIINGLSVHVNTDVSPINPIIVNPWNITIGEPSSILSQTVRGISRLGVILSPEGSNWRSHRTLLSV
jgi:hypothetical protein